MGLLQNGKWVDQWYDTKSNGGHFVRKAPQFRSWVEQMVLRDQAETVGLRQSQVAIIYMYLWPVHGRIAR